MSVIVVNKTKISASQINDCCSKMMYSFPRAERFPSMKNIIERSRSKSDACYYSSYFTSNKGKYSFGKQKRQLFPKYKLGPSPNKYNLNDHLSSFRRNKSSNSFSFGLSWESFRKNGNIPIEFTDYSIPGPGSYQFKTFFGFSGQKYSLKGRYLEGNLI